MQTEIHPCSLSINCDSPICVSHVPFDMIYPQKKATGAAKNRISALNPALPLSQKIQTRGQGMLSI